MTQIKGKKENVQRRMTGLYTLDHACANDEGVVGIPVGVGYEVFGLTGTGKSTFCYSMAGILGKLLNGNIALGDFEGYDEKNLLKILSRQGFPDNLDVISSYVDGMDEKNLDKFVKLMKEDCEIGIIDSIGAISPENESEGAIGDRNMGGRGFIMAQFFRKLLRLFRTTETKTLFATNHWYPKLGGYGYVTPGGEVKNFLCTVRIKLKRLETFPDGSYALQGEIVKNRWGFQNKLFNVIVLAGMGIHPGMTALWDCIQLKLVKRSKKTGISIGDEKYPKLGIYGKAAKNGETEPFEIFYKLLEEYDGKDKSGDSGNSETDTSESESEDDETVDD